jgi:hypothetical protein
LYFISFFFQNFEMGNFFSSFFSSDDTQTLIKSRMSLAGSRLSSAVQSVWSWGGSALWTCVTAGIVLAVPVFFEYERECQLFDQMQQMQAAQMAAADAAM